jgi:transposase
MVYVGLDVHRKRTQVAVLDAGGTQLSNCRVVNEELGAALSQIPPGSKVAFEAAYGWGWLTDLADELGLEAHMAHPLKCKAIASARLKNDKVDAATLAHLVRTDLLAEAHIAPPAVRDLRALLRHRTKLVRLQTASKNRIHAVLADRGIKGPGSLWTKSGRHWLEALELPEIRRVIVSDSLALIDALEPVVTRLDKDIRAHAKPDARVRALMSLPGIGYITALSLIAEIDDVSRFPSARKLCAWAGLVPSHRNSCDTVRHGHITKQGPAHIRWLLIQAANVAKQRAPYAQVFARIAHRRGKAIATVAVARKLLARGYHLLQEAQ